MPSAASPVFRYTLERLQCSEAAFKAMQARLLNEQVASRADFKDSRNPVSEGDPLAALRGLWSCYAFTVALQKSLLGARRQVRKYWRNLSLYKRQSRGGLQTLASSSKV